ncbi:MAG: hypothetical protein KY466_08765 [Gemmatimonadetes bacterium]|nr:hypothetical protein [Gemmatimonadota bacterium]
MALRELPVSREDAKGDRKLAKRPPMVHPLRSFEAHAVSGRNKIKKTGRSSRVGVGFAR